MVTNNEKSHDLGLILDQSGVPGRMHHVAWWVDSRDELLRAADILLNADIAIEFGPGRHGMGEQDYLYFREPGGVRIEINTGGYRLYVPDWETKRWHPDQGSNTFYRNVAMPDSMMEATPPAELAEDANTDGREPLGRGERPLRAAAMSDIRKVLIVGAGIGGLGAGAALAQRGVEVEIVEIKPEPNVYGVGINQPANSLRALAGARRARRGAATSASSSTAGTSTTPTATSSSTCPRSSAATASRSNNGLARRNLHEILIGAADRAGVQISYGTTRHRAARRRRAPRSSCPTGARRSTTSSSASTASTPRTRKRLFGDGYDAGLHAATASGASRCRGRTEITYGALYQAPGAKAGYIPLSQELDVPAARAPRAAPRALRPRRSTSRCCASASRRSGAWSATSATSLKDGRRRRLLAR